jgi:hypothetical protein
MQPDLKSLVIFCIFLFCNATVKAAPQGMVDGHLTIVSPKPAGVSDNMPRPQAPEAYTKYPLSILTQDGKKEVRQITADENGDYRAELPAGAYILDVKRREPARIRAQAQPFVIVSNETVHVDLKIFVGFGPQAAMPKE